MPGCYNHMAFKHIKQDTRTQHSRKTHMQLHLCIKEARNFSSIWSVFQKTAFNSRWQSQIDTLFPLRSDYSFCRITEPSYLATTKSKSTLQHLLFFLSLPLLHAVPVLPIQAPSPQAECFFGNHQPWLWEVESPIQKTIKNFTGSKAPMSSVCVRIQPGLTRLSCSRERILGETFAF